MYIATTFAHGNGPFSRTTEWAIEVNNVREERGLPRLPIVVPLVYPGRQERILKEEIATNVSPDFLKEHPYEIWFDREQGELLAKLLFKGASYMENLEVLARNYQTVEDNFKRYLDGKREIELMAKPELDLEILEEFDLRDAELQLGLNNRIQTWLPNQFYAAGGAGPLDELLERAIYEPRIKINRDVMKSERAIARRLMKDQRLIFSNEPGVFSYDSFRSLRENERLTPPFIHTPKPDSTELPGRGIYLLMTGIDGVRESGMYDAVTELGMQLFAPIFSTKNLPESIRDKVFELAPSRINNPDVVAQYARAGWSSVWLSHLAEKGFLTPPYNPKDDPEMLFNEEGIRGLKLGVIVGDNPKVSLEEALVLAEGTGSYNNRLFQKYGTLDGINYAAESIANEMGY